LRGFLIAFFHRQANCVYTSKKDATQELLSIPVEISSKSPPAISPLEREERDRDFGCERV
jgi:hypothetical protein